MERAAGILLHITSLPSPCGIGNLGREAYRFVDFLKKAKQQYWQILPISPTGYGDSPYQSPSTFAGNPYLIDPEQLQEKGWLRKGEAESFFWGGNASQADFGTMFENREQLLRLAFSRFCEKIPDEFEAFRDKEREWLEEYALFMALKKHFGGGPWTNWETDIRLHRASAVKKYRVLLEEDILYHCFTQYCFFAQWQKLRDYARENGIRIIGDIPIYVPLDSADVWSNPENYQLTRTRRPRVVAGCPPDGFNADGQYWGNPIYDWEKMEKDGFSWWMRRIGAAARCFDVIRIDHFRGLESYWAVPARHKTARKGVWVKGPGTAFLRAVKAHYPQTQFIAEDLGFLTPEVHALVRRSGYPGMKVLEFAFDPEKPSVYLPHKYKTNCICYTGTHDNETLHQFCTNLPPKTERYTRDYFGIGPEESLESTILQAGMGSKAQLFMAQMQDYLGLGGEARMNEPGKFLQQNWRWRMLPGAADDALAEEIAELTQKHHRV